ncbi:thioesterase II family protein [Nonomuraea harbinensis]|uniref:thioesterase II family protein n=1 Tax=Nonomuraea harbinensis TaxID=1286938 RepID=UPI001C5F188A|nr:thioesterase domain-containing protein [Nonomuraea harbinensis]
MRRSPPGRCWTIAGFLTAAQRTPHPTVPAPARTLFCLPYAGGGASAYGGLLRELAGLTVTPIQLPGRENRIAEPPAFTVGEIADEIEPATGGPYALYGHSMGARLAFEVVRELRRRDLPPPSRLYVGGAHPPHRKVPLAATADLPDEAFIDQLVRRSGALPELKHVPELRELLLPVLRADFAWIKSYRYEPEPPVDTPIVAFTGLDDGEVGAADMLGWARHTTAGFRLRTLAGGHLFVKDRPGDLAALIAADLAGVHPLPDLGEVHLWLGSGPLPYGEHGDAGLTVATCQAAGLVLTAATRAPTVGVALTHPAGPVDAARWLSAGEREQVEGAAEEDRRWLELRAVTAKRALAAAAGPGADPTAAGFPDLADPAPWRASEGRLSGWWVVHLPVPTARGEAPAAVAVPDDRVRLRFDTLPDRAG